MLPDIMAALRGLVRKTVELLFSYITALFGLKAIDKKETQPVEEMGQDRGRMVLPQRRETFFKKDDHVSKAELSDSSSCFNTLGDQRLCMPVRFPGLSRIAFCCKSPILISGMYSLTLSNSLNPKK